MTRILVSAVLSYESIDFPPITAKKWLIIVNMSALKNQFEKQLRQKLSQKSTSHISEETVLVRAFKYFDLDNTETVDIDEWKKAMEKIGIQFQSDNAVEELFRIYDVDRSGNLDYKEFAAIIGGDGGAPAAPAKSAGSNVRQEGEAAIEKLRERLASRGGRGIIGLARQFKIMDDDNSKELDFQEFSKAIRDFRVEVTGNDIQNIFKYIDRNRSGAIDYDEFLRAVRGPMNGFRKAIVAKAFNKLDADGSGILDINDIKRFYNARGHPDVRSGKKTEDEILGEFLETFEMHHSITGGVRDRRVTREEFEEYYNNISSSIDNDQYFELMMNNAWKLGDQQASKQAWRGDVGFAGQRKTESRRGPPFGVSGDRTEYATSSKPVAPGANVETLAQLLRDKLAGRGARGFIGLSRQFKIMDDDGSKCLNVNEFVKAMRDFRLGITDEDARRLFAYMDADRSGEIDYEEFVHRIRGPMNNARKQLVSQAFRKLDKNGNGIVELEDIKGVYNASQHPDVRSGKKTEDDILCEFLDTFETHHAVYKENTRDFKVTIEEFMEYYSHVSASIDDDRYFELMMKNSWNFEGKSYQKGWAADMSSPPKRGRY